MPLVDDLIMDDDELADADKAIIQMFDAWTGDPHLLLEALIDFADCVEIVEVTYH